MKTSINLQIGTYIHHGLWVAWSNCEENRWSRVTQAHNV